MKQKLRVGKYPDVSNGKVASCDIPLKDQFEHRVQHDAYLSLAIYGNLLSMEHSRS